MRLGQPVKVREGLREATMDALMERHPLRKDPHRLSRTQ